MRNDQIPEVNPLLQKLTEALARPGCWWELQNDGSWKFIRSTCPKGCTCNEPRFARPEHDRREIEGLKVEISGEFRGNASLKIPKREGAAPHSKLLDLDDVLKAQQKVLVVVDGTAGEFTPCICPENQKPESGD